MPKKTQQKEPIKISPADNPDIYPEDIPEPPPLPEEEADIIPDEELFETPPYEPPPPGEGP